MEYKMLSTENIFPNKWNPNEMSENTFSHLKEEIKRVGCIDPVTVWEVKKGKYEIIDGEHRFLAAKELGLKEVPVIILEVKDKSEAQLLTLNLNRIKGVDDPLKLAKVVTELSTLMSPEELDNILRIKQEELEMMKELLTLPDPELHIKELEGHDDFRLVLIFGEDQKDTIVKALELAEGKSNEEKLVTICKVFLKEVTKK